MARRSKRFYLKNLSYNVGSIHLKLDMSRGKPSSGQLDLGMGLLNAVDAESLMQAENGLDTRNYGGLDGIPEAKRLMLVSWK